MLNYDEEKGTESAKKIKQNNTKMLEVAMDPEVSNSKRLSYDIMERTFGSLKLW